MLTLIDSSVQRRWVGVPDLSPSQPTNQLRPKSSSVPAATLSKLIVTWRPSPAGVTRSVAWWLGMRWISR